ncbi:MAG TPA: hypothetical protein VF937_10420 [Chloroflexota bacterium]
MSTSFPDDPSSPTWGRGGSLALEPSVGAAYSNAWEVLKVDFWQLLLVGFVAWLLGGVVGGLLGSQSRGGASALSGLYQILIGTPIFYGAAYAWLRAVRGQKPEVSDLFVPFQRYWLTSVLAGLLTEVIVVVGFILLIVPGIYLAVRLSFVPFIVVDEGRGPVEALTESWRRTEGFFWTIFGSGLLGIVVVIVGFVLLIVGSIPAFMLVYLAFASLYAAITARKLGAGAADRGAAA